MEQSWSSQCLHQDQVTQHHVLPRVKDPHVPEWRHQHQQHHFDAGGIDVLADVHGDSALGVEHDVVPLHLDGDIAMISFNPWWRNWFYWRKTGNRISNGILLPKWFWPTVRKICLSDREKLLKFKAEGREFEKFWDH